MMNISKTSIRDVDHRQSRTAEKYENNVPSEADDLFFPPAISPKHEDYPILDDNRQDQRNLDAMKYVQNALALWVISNENSEGGTPVTIETNIEEADSKKKSNAESKISTEVNTPATPDPFPLESEPNTSPSTPLSPTSTATSPRRKSSNKSRMTKGKSVSKTRARPSTADNYDVSSRAAAVAEEADTSHSSFPGTPTDLDENGNRTPESSMKLNEDIHEIVSQKVLCTASTQTIYNGNTICTQTTASMTELKEEGTEEMTDELKIRTKESTQSAAGLNGDGNLDIFDMVCLNTEYPVDSCNVKSSRSDVKCQSKVCRCHLIYCF